MLNRGLDKLELLRIVDAVANEKSIDKELVIGSMESAIQKAALTKFESNTIEVLIDESGDIKIHKVLDIVENVEDPSKEINLEDAKAKNKDLKVGDKIYEELPQPILRILLKVLNKLLAQGCVKLKK